MFHGGIAKLKQRLGIKIVLPGALLIFLILFFVNTLAYGAAEPLQVKVQVGGTLNLRSGPATTYPVLSKLPSGTLLDLISHEEEWLLVRSNDGNTGWVSAGYTSFTPSLKDKLPPARGTQVIVQTPILNVRGGPGVEYPRLKQVRLDETLPVYQQQDGWLLIRLADGSTGWVSDNYVTSPPEPEAGRDQNDIDESEQDMLEAGNNILPLRVTVTASSLRMRQGPGLQHQIVAVIPKNTILLVRDEQEQWLKVGLPDGREGWVAGWHTQPLNSGNEENTESQSPRLATVNTSVLRVRSGPGLDFSQVDRVFSGNHLLVLDEEKGWNYVQLPNNSYGWVSGDYTSDNNLNTGRIDSVTIVIDPGHGGQDRGATGINGLLEKEVNLEVSLQVAEQLRARGFNVIMTRNSDVEINLEERVQIAERANADLFISIHANAHPNPAITGTEAFYASGKSSSVQSYYMATLLQQEVSRALHLPSLGTKTARFIVIRETTMPAALLELAFLSNAVDEALLRTPQAQQKAADAIVRAILTYYNAV